MAHRKGTSRFRSDAVIIMTVYAVFWLLIGIFELISKDTVGVIHLIPAILTGSLILLVKNRPFLTGRILVAVGIILSIIYLAEMHGGWLFRLQAVLVVGVPLLVSGAFLLTTPTSIQPACLPETLPPEIPPADPPPTDPDAQ
ncbi:MAG: hypothetical protein PHV74_01475 [Dehalococcoidia bacterium]|nr:hypothetical protein [Dehalococcoidia bacterium]